MARPESEGEKGETQKGKRKKKKKGGGPVQVLGSLDVEGGTLVFLEEYITPVKREPKIGRNAPCPCKSGKKYKHCCMRG